MATFCWDVSQRMALGKPGKFFHFCDNTSWNSALSFCQPIFQYLEYWILYWVDVLHTVHNLTFCSRFVEPSHIHHQRLQETIITTLGILNSPCEDSSITLLNPKWEFLRLNSLDSICLFFGCKIEITSKCL